MFGLFVVDDRVLGVMMVVRLCFVLVVSDSVLGYVMGVFLIWIKLLYVIVKNLWEKVLGEEKIVVYIC